MSRTGFQYALAALNASLVEGSDKGVLNSVAAGLNAAAAMDRELSDLEQHALDHLMGQLTSSGGEPETAGDAAASQAPVTSAVGKPTPAASVEEQPMTTAQAQAFYNQEPLELNKRDALFNEQTHDEDDAA